jgi:benzylsuccinate CoA-transferase BbsF subunit
MAKEALAGVKVADFSWNAVGPIMGSYMAKHGATVVKVESIHRLDSMRTSPPFLGGKPGPNLSACFPYLNHGKYGITLDLRQPRAVAVARQLADWADVLLESFTPGTMKKWGLSYLEVRETNPEVVYFSTCNQGQTGPNASQPGFGTQLTALSGITHVTGWPDRGPSFPFAAHTDFVSMRFGFATIIAALAYRERTGKGQYLDLSQHEASLHLQAPSILDYEISGRVAGRMGNRSPSAAPQGAYRCRGDDGWCALSVGSDEEWGSFRRAMGEPAWSRELRFATGTGRKDNEDELDVLVSQWTLEFPAAEAAEALHRAGVSAGVVQSGRDIHSDPQLKARGFFESLEHPTLGSHVYHHAPFHLSRTPEVLRRGHCLGEHTEYVLTQLLGMSDDEFTGLLQEGALD